MTTADLPLRAARTCFPPLAPLVTPHGTLFRVLARGDAPVALQLYDDAADPAPSRTLPARRRGDLCEVLVAGVGEGQAYTWTRGGSPLLDPCAVAFTGPARFGVDATPPLPRPPWPHVNENARFKSLVVAPPAPIDWERPATPWRDTVLYELNVRGFTRSPSSGVAHPGTFLGLTERIDHLKALGVTAVELLPVAEFDETEVRHGQALFNFWGYSPIGWFAPNRRHAAAADRPLGPLEEFRATVRAFHAAGIQVVVDVVFNHTAELHARGPLWHLRALADDVYYLHDPEGSYRDLTGCGNTVNAQHPAARTLILQALRWWVHGLGVDGFRFDLAAILGRDEQGRTMPAPPLLRAIEEDPWLAGVHLIAEAWDGAPGGYQVGTWPGNARWAVWNDRFRDDVRRAWLFDPHLGGVLATRLTGSSDLFYRHGPLRGVNYVTAHDGLTLRDVVSYARKHNEANGEQGRDGHDGEPSSNHGEEGETRDRAVRAERDRARRNLAASLLLAHGVPMLLGGDELGRTQRGNNNAYCHDSELTWVDWRGATRDAAFLRFVKGLVALRRGHDALRRDRFLDGDGDVRWLGVEGGAVDWENPGAFGYVLGDGAPLCVLVNLYETHRTFELPPAAEGWRLAVDTAATPPHDLYDPPAPPHTRDAPALVTGRSLQVYVGQPSR